jgi:DNA polymerase I
MRWGIFCFSILRNPIEITRMEKLFIVDAVNYLFRSYYAIGPMTNDKGQSTSALFGFIRSVKKLIEDFSPDYLVCVFDGPDNKKARQALYAEYKMHRKGAPEDLFPQFALTNEFCKFYGIPTLCIENVEADDTMASVATWARSHENMEIYLCTSDKDLFQLVEKHIFVVLPNKDNLIVDREKVKELFGVYPEQMLDYLSIVGDASDNIPGLPGFGPKTAVELLEKFKSLDEILKHPEKIPGPKKQQILREEQDKALLSRELATLNYKIEIPKTKSFYRLKTPDLTLLAEFFQQMNFMKFLKEIGTVKKEESDKEEVKEKEERIDYHLINDEKSFLHLLNHLSKESELCIDTETNSLNPLKAKLVGIGFCIKPQEGWYVALNGNIEEKTIINSLTDFFHSSSIKFYGHNIKYDLHVLANLGIHIKHLSFDTMIASYLISPQHRRHNLDLLSLEYFGKVKISYQDLTEKDKKKIPLQDVELEKVAEYCCQDVDYTCRLKKLFEKELKKLDLDKVNEEIEIPLIPVLAKMERKGIFIDEKKFEKLNNEISLELEIIEKKIYEEVGHKFNINSPKQLSDVLYLELKLPAPARKKTAFSTSADVLDKLASDSPFVEKILKYRTLQKLYSTYIEALPQQINSDTKRIHPTFNQSVTATGRLSCQDPNLQNIPVRTKEGKKIREGFRPQKEGWSYVDADYSQIELKLLAHFSKDPELIRAFKHNEDIHAYTASLVYKIDIKEVTPKMRSIAKAVNFGTIYGQGAYGLSQLLNIPFAEAQEFIKTYFERYTEIESFIEKCKKEAYETKVAKTLFGRRRPIPEIDSKNPSLRHGAERLAINTPLQGTAADIIKLAMIAIDKEIEKEKLEGFMILQIHDELIFEVPDKEIDMFEKLVRDKMEKVVKLEVPLTVDLQVGKNWGEC